MKVDLARANRIPPDWGLEVGMLAEFYRNCAIKRICQVDICDNYEHKHQPLSPDDPESGLLKMTIEIVKILFRTLAAEGIVLDNGVFNSLLARYVRNCGRHLETLSRRCPHQRLEFRQTSRRNCSGGFQQRRGPGAKEFSG